MTGSSRNQGGGAPAHALSPVQTSIAQDQGPCQPIDVLIASMNLGDRDAAAEFLDRYGARLRRRIHGKIGHSLRRVFDSQDILSTIGRRLDKLLMRGRLHVGNEAQLWALVSSMAQHAIVDKARKCGRSRQVTLEHGQGASARRMDGNPAPRRDSFARVEIRSCFRDLTDPLDRRILALWLRGKSHGKIAATMHLSVAAIGKRWAAIKRRLRRDLTARGIMPKSSRRR